MRAWTWNDGPRRPYSHDVKKYFRPASDITAYELAIFISNYVGNDWPPSCGIYFTTHTWDNLPADFKRHFQDEKEPGR